MKKYYRSSWKLIVLFFVCALLVSACSTPADNGAAPVSPGNAPVVPSNNEDTVAPEDREPVTIRFGTHLVPDQAHFWAIGDAFEEKFPWITVEWVNTTIDNQALDLALAANNPLDVWWHSRFMHAIEYAEDLTPWIENDPEFQAYDFSPGMNEPFMVDGRQMGLSRGHDTFLIFYNKELLSKYGLEKPAFDWTWEDLRQMAIKATNPAEKNWGIANSGLWFHFGATAIPTSNGSAPRNMMMLEDLSASVADDPNVMDDLDWMLKWVTEDGIMLNNSRMLEHDVTGDMWAQGQTLFMLHVSPLIAVFNDTLTFDWDILPLPRGTQKQVGMGFNSAMHMSKASKNKEAAWEFMKFWAATVEGQQKLIDAGGTLPNSPNPEIIAYFNQSEVYQGLDTAALIYASNITQTEPTATMIGGSELGDMIANWAHSEGYQNEVSAFDYFPAAVEQLNEQITILRAEQ